MAIEKEIFRALIKEGQEEILSVQLYDRPFEFEPNGRYVMVGIRQAGKSYMLYKRAKELLAMGHSVQEFLYIDFDDERLLGMQAMDFDTMLQAYGSVYSHKPILFFDEIQNIDGWEHFARRLANHKYNIYITGSNARMLSKDIQTTLGSRFLEAKIYPYTFKEYLEAQNIVLQQEWEYGKSAQLVQQKFNEYLKTGGFPELLLFDNKRKWLNQLYEKIILGDIVLKNRIKNELGLRLIYKRLVECIGKPVSYNRLSKLVNATGVKTTTTSVIDYIRFAVESCLVISIENYASKFVERESIKKHYLIDNGFVGIFYPDNHAMLLENLCAVYLKESTDEVYFYNENAEVDFYMPDQEWAVQACWSVADSETLDREVNALVKLDSHKDLHKMQIVTYDDESTIPLPNGKAIEIVPAWKWMLQDRE